VVSSALPRTVTFVRVPPSGSNLAVNRQTLREKPLNSSATPKVSTYISFQIQSV
jgi:hypothetical protein